MLERESTPPEVPGPNLTGEHAEPGIAPTFSPLAVLKRCKSEHPDDFLDRLPDVSFKITVQGGRFIIPNYQ